MAKYKTLPNYELIRPGIHILFDPEGYYTTENELQQKYLDTLSPFIERLDKPEEKPKAPAKPKK